MGAHKYADVLIVGDGVVARATALALRAALGRAARIVMAVKKAAPNAARDGRAYAISASGRELLVEIGAWKLLEGEACPILDIAVTDSRLDDGVRPVFLTFSGEVQEDGALAHMVEAQALAEALASGLAAAGVERLELRPRTISLATDGAEASFGELPSITAALLVAADGVRSFCREAAGIGWIGWRYDQLGLTTTIAHERDHGGCAVEHFLPGGPFASLPLKRRRSSIVWAEEAREARRILSLQGERLIDEVARRFGRELGEISLEGPLLSYPLNVGVARAFIGQRLALVGDAAHAVHPVAGQGLNLGLRDARALADAVAEAARLGLDPGSPQALSAYQRSRRFDTVAMGALTDGLVRLFSNDHLPLRTLRDLGLGLVERNPTAKRFLTAQARGRVARPALGEH